MTEQEMAQFSGEFSSPGGFAFGVQGWSWGEQRPSSITFFLNGTATVADQHGRPVKGVVRDGKAIYFSKCTHAQVIAALADERVDWRQMTRAGWPQLSYAELKVMANDLPPTPTSELRKIPDAQLRKDALRIRREVDAEREKEMQTVEGEEGDV